MSRKLEVLLLWLGGIPHAHSFSLYPLMLQTSIIIELVPSGDDRPQLKSPFIRPGPSVKPANCSDLCRQSHPQALNLWASHTITKELVKMTRDKASFRTSKYPSFQAVGCRYVTGLTGQMAAEIKQKVKFSSRRLPWIWCWVFCEEINVVLGGVSSYCFSLLNHVINSR